MDTLPEDFKATKLESIYDKLDNDTKRKILNILKPKPIIEPMFVIITPQIDKTTDKYKTALKFINKILHYLKKQSIEDLKDFKDIDRELLITPYIRKIFDNMEEEIFNHFDKNKCGWYRRNIIKNYILTLIRSMCQDLRLSFEYKKRDITVYKKNKGYRRTQYTYYIN